jgi:hypothetical protein
MKQDSHRQPGMILLMSGPPHLPRHNGRMLMGG